MAGNYGGKRKKQKQKYDIMTLTLEKELVQKLRQQGYNISQLVRNFLREKLEKEKKCQITEISNQK